ncbi:hypothetical protein [uncultured Devosia sp.]|uniref:hypothetical protein n=1 Tax=uncultured Devosia sp. TaxID=211434 RepID=UPI0035CBB363
MDTLSAQRNQCVRIWVANQIGRSMCRRAGLIVSLAFGRQEISRQLRCSGCIWLE